MKSFVDLVGASGTAYRFRKTVGALSPMGGNFVYVRDNGGALHVICCGKARSLGRDLSESNRPAVENVRHGDQLYVRLNAAGGARNAEHEDLLAGLPRPFTIYDIE